ncbi:MAG: response regulator [Thermodesulfovibrionales bacterium]|jgi:DNA-binding response OmpR family regulator|nr:response regulator [Thermodesulfovibrionales bacterium]
MPYKLLLADDSLTIQKVVELVLAPEDFEIRAFNDGEQALQALESFKPDIILADIEMPKLNGYQLCEKIKNDMATAMIPVILLAGAFEPFDEEYAKSVYADDFIIKPFESQELISKVKALLKNFEPAKQAEAEEIQEEELLSEAGTSEVSVGLSGAMSESVELSKLEVQEPRWDEEIPVAEEKAEEQVMAEEEYEAKGFEAELSEAMAGTMAETMKEEEIPTTEEHKEPLAAPVIEQVSEIPQGSVEEKISGVIVSDVLPRISSAIKDSVEQAVSSIAPDIIENVTRELMKDLMGSMRGEIEAAIKRIVPEVAETLIKKEIEKITSELS